MALQQEITLTVKGYTITLSKPLTLFVNDSLDLIITLKQFGITNPNTPSTPVSEPFDLTNLTVIMYVEAANGVDELESTNVVDNNITFHIKPVHTRVAGKGKMQIVLLDRDGGRLTLPSFEYEVKETINDVNNIPLPSDVHALSNETRTIIATSAEQYVELGGGIIELSRIKMTELPKVDTVKNTDIVLLETTEGSRTATKENLLKEVNSNIRDIVTYQGKSNIDLTGKEHDTLEDRLRADNTILLDKINNAKYLPYEEEYITAANSYLGMTKGNVIKGRTLQNLCPPLDSIASNWVINNGSIPIAFYTKFKIDKIMFKPNTLYTAIFITPNDKVKGFSFHPWQDLYCEGKVGKFTTNDLTGTPTYIHVKGEQGTLLSADDLLGMKVILLEGDYTNKPIPAYFEGIKSINEEGENLAQVSCGKNLFDGTYYPIYHDVNNGITENTNCRTAIVRVEPNTTYYIERYNAESTRWSPHQYDRYPKIGTKGSTLSGSKGIYTTNSNTKYITLYVSNTMEEPPLKVYLSNQIISEYEPYSVHRISIKMKNLRSLPSGVCDTSDGVRRIGKIVLDGVNENLNYALLTTRDTTVVFSISGLDKKKGDVNFISDRFITMPQFTANIENMNGRVDTNTLVLEILKDRINTPDIRGLKTWLQSNPITVYYELSTPTKEEGNAEELRTYDGTTNIFTEGSLIEPTISCKVPSNVQAVVMSLREENEALNNNVNTLQTTSEENNLTNIETNLDQEARLTMLELGVI